MQQNKQYDITIWVVVVLVVLFVLSFRGCNKGDGSLQHYLTLEERLNDSIHMLSDSLIKLDQQRENALKRFDSMQEIYEAKRKITEYKIRELQNEVDVAKNIDDSNAVGLVAQRYGADVYTIRLLD
jgi:hypothetical protein